MRSNTTMGYCSKALSITSMTASDRWMSKKRRELVELFEVCHTIVYGDYPRNVQGLEADELSYAIAGTLPMDLMWKQQVLELRSEADRQERLLTYLREWAPHLQKIESQRQHAEGNGNAVN